MSRGWLRNLLTCWLLLLYWAAVQAGAPAAGTVIRNTALASFVDTTSGNSVRLSSNTVDTVVLPLEAVTLTADQALTLASGTPFTAGHVLTNTGNVAAKYRVATSVQAGSAFVPSDVQVVQDVNRNARVDAGEPQVGPAGIDLEPGATAYLLVTGLVPASAGVGQAAMLVVEAITAKDGARARNVDTLTATSGAALQVTLAASVASTRPGDTVEWLVSASNTGNADVGPVALTVDGAEASLWRFRMAIPVNTTFSSARAGSPAEARLLYHVVGAAIDSYVSAPPAAAAVDAVAWALPVLAPGRAAQGRFSVTVHENAAGTLTGVAQADWSDRGTRKLAGSNTVLLGLPTRAPGIRFFASDQYSAAAVQTTAGRPLYVQVDAAMCNTESLRPETVPVNVVSQLSGDTEVFMAVETGANTGLFRILPDVPTANAALHVVATGNGVLEVLRNDIVTASITACGGVSVRATTDLLVDPSGVVFDSRSNLPLAGATVELIDVAGAGNGGQPGGPARVLAEDGVSAAPSKMVTGADGVFSFPLLQPSTYRLKVTPARGFTFPSALPQVLQPAGRIINSAGSYGRDFRLDSRPVRFDVPLDTGDSGGLVVEKRASKTVAEVGGFVDYTVRVANVLQVPLPRVEVLDALPAGFTYVPGSARLDGAPLADPQAVAGGRQRFAVGTIGQGKTVALHYRVRIGAGSLGGSGINTAEASGSGISSNRASVKVQVVGGVFADDAYVIGKVYADCNRNRLQDAGEPGIPGVRIYLDDGTYTVTDEEGKYSVYGLVPRTHVAKVDRTTLPAGTRLEVLDQRNGGDAGSRFVDLTRGELHKADFVVSGCGPALDAQLTARRAGLNRPSEITQAASMLLSTTPPSAVDARTLPASGTLGLPGAAPGSPSPRSPLVADG
ncbi:SdrD B-like domain-containing protein, partial [Ramlibacter alkalitolerans]